MVLVCSVPFKKLGRIGEKSLGIDIKPLDKASNHQVIKLYLKLDFV